MVISFNQPASITV